MALGGLISTNQTGGAGGVPFLKDIPLAGSLFKSDTRKNDQTELIILITPYVIDNDNAADQVTQAMRDQLGGWARAVGPTNTPIRKMSTPPHASNLEPEKDAAGKASNPDINVLPDLSQPSQANLPKPRVETEPEEERQTLERSPHTIDAEVSGTFNQGAPSQENNARTIPFEIPPGGKVITDPKILDEFRRDAGRPPGETKPKGASPAPAHSRSAETANQKASAQRGQKSAAGGKADKN